MNSVPADRQSAPAGSAAPAGAVDGYQRTLQAFQARVGKAREIMEVLNRINVEAKARVPGNSAKQQAYLATKLSELFPGSTYDGVRGKIVFQKNFEATFNSSLTVDTIAETGDITSRYLLDQGQILITFGSNSVTAVLNRSNPAQSRFTKADIPAIKAEAENILTIPGYMRKVTDSVETSVLNDAYQLLSQTNDLRMDYFAADVMRSGKLQKSALGIAASGYLERHPNEYQRGAEAASAASKTADRGERLTGGKLADFAGRLLLVIAIALGVFWSAGKGVHAIRMLFVDKVTRIYIRKYHSYSSMVIRALHRLGRTIWGRNLPWSRRYYITKRSDRWQLSDGKIDRTDPKSQPDNLIEVCLRDNNFKVRISRIRGTATDFALTTSGYSRQELLRQLQQLHTAFTQGDAVSGENLAVPAGEGSVPR